MQVFCSYRIFIVSRKEIAHNIAKQCIWKDKFYLTILKDDGG